MPKILAKKYRLYKLVMFFDFLMKKKELLNSKSLYQFNSYIYVVAYTYERQKSSNGHISYSP